FTPSPEQHSIVKACATSNVMVSARPGSGKTTTVEAILQDNPRTSMIVLTYSKRLQLDTLDALKPYGFEQVYTFHGLAGKLFNTVAKDDKALLDLRDKNVRPVWSPSYDLVVLDELQDMTETLYWLTCVFLDAVSKNQAKPPRLLCLGDPHQAIYEFRGADSRYLRHAEEVFKDVNPYPWVNQDLVKSFRLSHQTAAFVNSFITGTNYIQGSHDGPKPIYMHANLKDVDSLLKTIQPLIQRHTPDRCAILAPSIRSNLYLPLLTNALSKDFGIPVAVSYNDDAPLDSDVVHGKLVASTFHQFKGSERDLVIVYGFDASYFPYMAPELPDDRCPNALYVAITRPKQQLVVLHHRGRSAIPFISWKGMKDTCQYRNVADEKPCPQNPPGRPLQLGLVLPTKVAVTEMARHVDDSVLNELVNSYLKIEKVKSAHPEEELITFPEKIQTDEERNHYEAVSDLNGLAVTAAFEWAMTSKC
ncbi:P-loop containing nucleoside triphosphate hydrolase protein, partial [Serendipita vermifera]